MNSKGFTLVEVVIGLFIAVLASAYAAKTITSANKAVTFGRESFVATNLAHEGLDLTRAMRDNTRFMGGDPSEWLSLSGICEGGSGKREYNLDTETVRNFVNDPERTRVLPAGRENLYIQPNKQWTHANPSGSVWSGYRRRLEADCSHIEEDPAYVVITARATWIGSGGQQRSVFLTERLYNWF